MRTIKKVAIVGGGVIGSGWAARLLINGYDVVISDPSDECERRVQVVIDNAIRAYRKMTLAPIEQKGKLSFERSTTEAVKDADFVQESGPERIDIKKAIFKEICDNTGADVIVASSSSGLLPSEIQADVQHPERVIIGHPFNPVYLLPLVEIVGGDLTKEQHKKDAAVFYESIGMHSLQVRKEVDAYLSDRLQEALWREALHLVNEGVATTEEIDQAICYGPGLRWSFMGVFMIYRVAGGEGGMRHFMEQFGPSLKWPWTRFDGPDLTEELLNKVTEQSDAQAAGRSIVELERLRDDCLVTAMQGLRGHNFAAGATLKKYEESLYETSHQNVMSDDDIIDAPLRLHSDTVHPEWVDYNNHMTESRYLQVFGDASDAMLRYIGVDADYHAEGFSYYTVETHICHIREVAVNQPLYVTTQVLSSDEKRMHLMHSVHHGTDDTQLATAEQMLLHVDTNKSAACPARQDMIDRLAKLATAHSKLEQPKQTGRAIKPAS